MGAFDSMGAGAAAGDKQQADIAQENRRLQLQAARDDEARRAAWDKRVADDDRTAWAKKQAETARADALKQQEFDNAKTVADYNDQKEKDRLARERQAKIDAQNTQKFNQASEWDAELKKREIEKQELANKQARLEAEKYKAAFEEEKAQRDNRSNLVKTSIGGVINAAMMNGGIIPKSAMDLFNKQHSADGLTMTGGAITQDGKSGGVIQFTDKDGNPVENFIGQQILDSIQSSLFGKESVSRSGRSDSGSYARDSLGLKQDSMQVHALQSYVSMLSGRLEKMDKAINDMPDTDAGRADAVAKRNEMAEELSHYSKQFMGAAGVDMYVPGKSGAGGAAPKKANPFAKLNGEKPASTEVVPAVGNDGKTITYKAGHTRVRRISDGKLGWIPTANLPADGYEEVK